jgi:hypothetical protein
MFDVGDMQGAADAIERLQDGELATMLSDAGRALAGARYSTEVSIARWSEAFREILAQPPLPPADIGELLQPTGRLDRWLGPRAGDALRSALGVAYKHAEPGGEWPHLLSRSNAERDRFDSLIAACEANPA